MRTWQASCGGWDKRLHAAPDVKNEGKLLVDRSWDGKERRSSLRAVSGEEAGTIADGATVNEMMLLAKVHDATGDRRYKDTLLRAVDFLLAMQHADGGGPLCYPPLGDESDRVEPTAMVRAMAALSMAERGVYPLLRRSCAHNDYHAPERGRPAAGAGRAAQALRFRY